MQNWKKKQNDGTYFAVESFSSVAEFTNYLNRAKTNEAFAKAYGSDSELSSQRRVDAWNDFYGTQTWEEAQNLMRSGYREGMNAIMQAKSSVKVESVAVHAERVDHVSGQKVNLSRFLGGQVDCMRRNVEVESKTRAISLYYDCGANCSESFSSLAKGGKNLLTLVQSLEARGIKVRLFVMDSACSRYYKNVVAIQVKDFDKALNPLLISYPVTHPSMMRRHTFRWTEVSQYTNYGVFTSGYGGVLYDTFGCGTANYLKGAGLLKENDYYINVVQCKNATSVDEMLKGMGF